MDPDEALKKLRELAAKVLAAQDDDYINARYICEEFAESFDALDEWLINGGFKPTDWDK